MSLWTNNKQQCAWKSKTSLVKIWFLEAVVFQNVLFRLFLFVQKFYRSMSGKYMTVQPVASKFSMQPGGRASSLVLEQKSV